MNRNLIHKVGYESRNGSQTCNKALFGPTVNIFTFHGNLVFCSISTDPCILAVVLLTLFMAQERLFSVCGDSLTMSRAKTKKLTAQCKEGQGGLSGIGQQTNFPLPHPSDGQPAGQPVDRTPAPAGLLAWPVGCISCLRMIS
jgi:hypothetical protein